MTNYENAVGPEGYETNDEGVQIGVASGTGGGEPGTDDRPKPFRFGAPGLSADGAFALPFTGEVGRRYQVFTSVDLTTWELWTDFTLESQEVELEFAPPAGEALRFFKVVTP
jgi:hypothetical protein